MDRQINSKLVKAHREEMSASSVPPPPAADESLNTYFAVQIKPLDKVHDVALAVMHAAKETKILFRHLEVLDTITIGTSSFVRMRSEIVNPFPILEHLYSSGRAVVSAVPGGEYTVRLQGGRTGKVAQTLMHATAKLGQSRMYRGTRFKYWDRQFAAA